MKHFLRYYAMERVDGILADLGVSSHQIDTPVRGFSYREDAVLDMRMDVRNRKSASQVLNESSREALDHLFRSCGELKNSGALAEAIVTARIVRPLRTNGDLLHVLHPFIPDRYPNKFLAKVYQALRMEVNREIESLGELLIQTADCMNRGGRLVMITYHSIEDRMVKNYMRSGNLEGNIEKDFYGNVLTPWEQVNRNVITPSREEIAENKRARSAKLRIAERI
jgi:16S rRNA (cytosine1402-N4)-methyltransferase